ncbi:hypothetical protein [Bacillus haynesii]|uniref:hypothetical protein n=1 Tax=Bacillus haynesii TaxID=1925021 RepID=UPI0022802835|nr:hypothetical protein [Bacillus haynesii]MCY8378393.1 hypothetical protein [Bacillus haynesii]MCY8611746.1 hypothetical protein [Bacillus haynesii]MEC0676648.1 hypothetical protein [Bacillus haynesii]
MFKKLSLTILVSSVVLFSILFAPFSSQAINNEDSKWINLNTKSSIVNGKKVENETTKVSSVDEPTKLQQIAKKNGLDVEASYESYITYDEDGKQTSSGVITSKRQQKLLEKKAANIVYLAYTFLGGKVNKVLHGVEVTKVVGTRPVTLEVQQALCQSGYYNKQFTCPHVIKKTFVGPQIKKGAEVHQFINVNKTTFWKYSGWGIATWAGKPPSIKTLTWNEALYLTNKKGTFFPNYTDQQSGLNLLAPSNVFIKKVPKEKRAKWGNKERAAYRDWYEKQYGKKTWLKYEIHHQLPRAYGGGNMTKNLIPVERSFHRGEITPWWASY